MADKIQTALFWLSAVVGAYFFLQITVGTWYTIRTLNKDPKFKILAVMGKENEVTALVAKAVIKEIGWFIVCAIVFYITY